MKKLNYKKLAMILGVSGVLLLTVGVSYTKFQGKYSIGKDSIAQSKDEEKKRA